MQVLENGDGGLQGTLLAAVDNCVTPAGRRRLRQWLCRPLFRIAHITERQDAVHDLTTVAEEAAAQARKLFAGKSQRQAASLWVCLLAVRTVACARSVAGKQAAAAAAARSGMA